MIENKEKLIIYLNASVNGIFKILPLYEEENIGIDTYVESLLFTLYGLDEAVDMDFSHEYITLLATLESIKKEIIKEDSSKPVIKREVFKCIHIVKNIVGKLEEGEPL